VLRGDELLCLDLTAAPPPADTWYLALACDVDEETLARRRAWLGG
jgi:hypothetical protein